MPEQAHVLMVQGTMSNAGKSVLTAGLCRAFARKGLRVAPFKAQNMSLNSCATPDGGEIGRAQAVQAAAAMSVPRVEMNPVLLKPEAERRSQVVVLGRPTGSATAREYYERKLALWPVVTTALDSLRAENDLVIIEGAGSPAEINLRPHEIVNMRVALHAKAPVLLVGDIDRGGVFAALLGTIALLEPEERELVKGFVINKLRGDPTLLDSGLDILLQRTGIPTLGILPYFTDIHIPEEDSLGLPLASSPSDAGTAGLDIAIIRLPRIANFDDFDPLRQEPGVRVRFVQAEAALGQPDLIIIPGSKTTIADLDWLRATGLARALQSHSAQGGAIIGICGGYQMLGEALHDPLGLEGPPRKEAGLGFLPVATTFLPAKTTTQTKGIVATAPGLLSACAGLEVSGYEIHMGVTTPLQLRGLVERGRGEVSRAFHITHRSGRPVAASDGAVSQDGLILGTYLHGLLHNPALRRALLAHLAARKGVHLPPGGSFDQDQEFEKLAHFLENHLDMDRVCAAAGLTALWRSKAMA